MRKHGTIRQRLWMLVVDFLNLVQQFFGIRVTFRINKVIDRQQQAVDVVRIE